jgi:hypothetical protein
LKTSQQSDTAVSEVHEIGKFGTELHEELHVTPPVTVRHDEKLAEVINSYVFYLQPNFLKVFILSRCKQLSIFEYIKSLFWKIDSNAPIHSVHDLKTVIPRPKVADEKPVPHNDQVDSKNVTYLLPSFFYYSVFRIYH